MFKKVVLIFFTLILIISSTGTPYNSRVYAETGTSIIITTDKPQYNVGDTVTVSVVSQSEADIYGIQFALSYNNSLLNLQSDGIIPSGNYKDFGGVTVDRNNGVLVYPLINSSTDSPRQKQMIGQAKFKALKKGTVNLQLSQIKAVDSNFNEINNNTSYSVSVGLNEVHVRGITLEKERSLPIGGTYKLSPSITPENSTDMTVKWDSSNPEIVTVDDQGNIIAKKAGTADIAVTTIDGNNTAACSVHVLSNNTLLRDIKVNDVSLNNFSSDTTSYNVVLPAGTTAIPRVAATAEDTDSIVTVTQPESAAGRAVILVKAEDGTGKNYLVNFSVKPIVAATGVTLDKNEMSLEKGATASLMATVTPTDADNKNIKWSSSNPEIVSVDKDGRITCRESGIAKITAVTEVGSLSASCEVIVRVDKTELENIINNTVQAGEKEVVLPQLQENQESVPVSLDLVQTSQNNDLNLKAEIGAVQISMPSNAIDINKYVENPTASTLILSQTKGNTTVESGNDEGIKQNGQTEAIMLIGSTYEIKMTVVDEKGTKTEIHNFDNNKKVRLVIQLNASDLQNVDTGKLSAYYFDKTNNKWEEIEGGVFDRNNLTFTFETSHFTEFAVMESKGSAINNGSDVIGTSIPKTGYRIDNEVLTTLGSLMIVMGFAIILRKKSKS